MQENETNKYKNRKPIFCRLTVSFELALVSTIDLFFDQLYDFVACIYFIVAKLQPLHDKMLYTAFSMNNHFYRDRCSLKILIIFFIIKKFPVKQMLFLGWEVRRSSLRKYLWKAFQKSEYKVQRQRKQQI